MSQEGNARDTDCLKLNIYLAAVVIAQSKFLVAALYEMFGTAECLLTCEDSLLSDLAQTDICIDYFGRTT